MQSINPKELEKAARFLSKYTDSTVLPKDAGQRIQIVRAVLLEDNGTVQEICGQVAQGEDGTKHLMRALNNCMPLANKYAQNLAKYLYCAATNLEEAFKQKKLLQLLSTLSGDLPHLDWLLPEALECLKTFELPGEMENYLQFLQELVRAELRTSADSSVLIEQLAVLRPTILSKEQALALSRTVWDRDLSWDLRSSALFLLMPLGGIDYESLQNFLDEGYLHFPLEALQGVEALSRALELDCTREAAN